MKCPSVLFMAFVGSLFCLVYCNPDIFFYCPFDWFIFFQSFTSSLCRSFVLRWVSYRQHMCRSCFLTRSAALCLLIRTFNPFTFKVIIDRHLLIAIFPLCSCVPHSHTHLLHLLKAVPSACSAMLVWWGCAPLAFSCLGNSLIRLPF